MTPFLDLLRGLRWPARRPVRGGPAGAHLARSRGTSVELSEYRAYRQGDDPRRLDWKLLARSDRAFVRLSPDHAVLPTLLVVDASATMDFGTKWATARDVAVGLAAVAHAQGDPVGLVLASGAGARTLPPRTRRGVVGELARTLAEARPAGTPALAPLLGASPAGRVVLVTDLLGDADALHVTAGRLMAAGAELHVAHVVARGEMAPPDEPMMAVDPEDAGVQRPLTPATRAAYLAAFDAWRAEEARRWREGGASYVEVVDDEPVERAVRRVVGAATGAAA